VLQDFGDTVEAVAGDYLTAEELRSLCGEAGTQVVVTVDCGIASVVLMAVLSLLTISGGVPAGDAEGPRWLGVSPRGPGRGWQRGRRPDAVSRISWFRSTA